MEAIRTSYATKTLRGEGYLDLPAAVWPKHQNGLDLYETAWKPTPEELADLVAGGTLYLYQLIPEGAGFPPVLLTTRTLAGGTPEEEAEQARDHLRAEGQQAPEEGQA